MKHTWTIAVALFAASCVSSDEHRRIVGERNALQAQLASMAEAQKTLSAENERLRNENRDLSGRAVDAAALAADRQKIADLLARYRQAAPTTQNGVELIQTPEGVAFRVAGNVLFAPGQNTLSESGKRTLTDIATQLADRRVRVEGHTDDQPIERSAWGTNLRLSVERSMVVADYLTAAAGLRKSNVSVAGYSEYRPAVEGRDDAARAKNRRVEILMLDN
jgi:flagellar motor protein MotB